MVKTITVGISSALKEITQSLPQEISGYEIVYTPFDINNNINELPDVISLNTLLLPTLASKNKLLALDENLVKEIAGEVHTFSTESAKHNGKFYGFPQSLSSDFLLTRDVTVPQEQTLVSLAKELSYDKLVHPTVNTNVEVVLKYIASTVKSGESVVVDLKETDLPKKAENVDKEAATKYKKLVNATMVVTNEEFVNSLIEGKPISNYYAGSIESLSHAKKQLEEQAWNIQPIVFDNDHVLVQTETLSVNATIDETKQKVAIELIKTLLNDDKIASVLSEKTLVVPAQKKRLSSKLLKQVDEKLSQVEGKVKVYRLVDVDINAVNQSAKTIKPFVQHLAVATIRCLAADTVEKAKSGHPGMPIGMAPIAYVLWKYFLKTSKEDVDWINRDRFVLSNGHGCALLYTMLCLTQYGLTMDDLKKFRTLDSKTPGHPEFRHTHGVDATTGPLGQGLCNAVGMAVAEAHLAARFNKDGLNLFDHFTYAFCGDGDLMEGVVTEGMSFAGHQKLNKIIAFYDDNQITIDGSTALSFTQDSATVATGLGWHVIVVNDADSDLVAVKQAVLDAHKVTDKPVMIFCKTTIGYASKLQGTAKVHGSPLGAEALKNLKELSGFSGDQFFHVPETVQQEFDTLVKNKVEKLSQWKELSEKYGQQHPQEYAVLKRMLNHELEGDLDAVLPKFNEEKKIATRTTSHQVLNAIYPLIPSLVGGSADLTPSNLTDPTGCKDFQYNSRDGRYFRFGVREHAMVAITNGILYHGILRTYAGTFLNFASYALGAIRLSALAQLPNIYVFTHDSIGLGQDGPTHQPVEVLPVLRSIPNMCVMRPADGRETSGAYAFAIKSTRTPTSLILSRQDLPQLKGSSIEGTLKGAYTLQGSENPDVILIGTGSEVEICVKAAESLTDLKVNVVSMPSWELFAKQSLEYKKSVLKDGVPVISVEASSVFGWHTYAHHSVGMTTFGASAPFEEIYKQLGITSDHVATCARKVVKRYGKNAPVLVLAPLDEENL
ncbi:hypothetical protein ABK040_002245 [Willaertia magna]